ncbi:unnamed protein product, partial [Prorocentrum cordatum]
VEGEGRGWPRRASPRGPTASMSAWTLDTRWRCIREGRRLAPQNRAAVLDGVMPDAEVVVLHAVFGGRFLPQRLPWRGGAVAPRGQAAALRLATPPTTSQWARALRRRGGS